MFRFLLAVGGLGTLFVWDGKNLGWDHAAGGGQLWLTLRCLTLTLEHSASFRKLWHIKANYCHPAVPYNANAYCSCGIITVASSEPLATLGLPRSSYCYSISSILKIHKIKVYMIFMLIYLLQSSLSLSIHKLIHHIHGLSRVSQCYAPIKSILENLLIFLKRNFTLRKRPLSKSICFGRIKAQLIHGEFSVLSSWRLNDGQTFVRLENCVYSVYMAVGFEDGRVVRWCPICWESQVCFRGLPSIQLASLGASGLLTSLF